MADKDEIYQKAMQLLVRREHSVEELKLKLMARFDRNCLDLCDEVLNELIENDQLSNQRYAEAIVSYRANRGYGPNWIRSFLRGKGVTSSIIDNALDSGDIDWINIATTTKLKKFGKQIPKDYAKKAKEFGFLLNKGFTKEQLDVVYNAD